MTRSFSFGHDSHVVGIQEEVVVPVFHFESGPEANTKASSVESKKSVDCADPEEKSMGTKVQGSKWKKRARGSKAVSSISVSFGSPKRKSYQMDDPMVLDDNETEVPLKTFCDVQTVEAGDQPRRQP